MTSTQETISAYSGTRERITGLVRDLDEAAAATTVPATADRFDLRRAMTGRRSVEQVEAFAWEGEPAIRHLCLLPARATTLLE